MNDPFSTGGLMPAQEDYDRMANAKVAGPMSMKQKLDMAVKQAEIRLADAKRAAEILAKNPDLEELLNLMQRNHF